MAVLERRRLGRQALSLLSFGTLFGATAVSASAFSVRADVLSVATVSTELVRTSSDSTLTGDERRIVDDSLRGRSGKLLVRLVARARATLAVPLFEQLFGDSAFQRPGLYALQDSTRVEPFTFIALRPFSDKQNGRVGSYRIGFWPQERGRRAAEAYDNPDGFIEITPENQDTRISEHFRLRDFLTHDQKDVWPKYLVLNENLVDKLELVIDELQKAGVSVSHMSVMSGFRTPWYNRNGGRTGGRAELSRHMYGDAADVFIDNNRDGRMDDLNRDGRVDSRDAKVLQKAVERVDQQHPELVGGVGVYRANRSHGPFAHVDVRGWRARWGRA